MSIRNFRPRRRSRRELSPLQNLILLSTLSIAIGLQIAYPLLDGEALRIVTIAVVYWGAAAMMAHSLFSYGLSYAARYFGTTFFFALAIEQIGVRTGWPFGNYTYSVDLGYQIYGVPLVVPCAWVMMAYPIFLMARRLSRHWSFLVGGYGLMAWDLFLDPQMVSAGRWKWSDINGSHVPFQPEIPMSNAFGWLFAGIILMSLLNLVLPRDRRAHAPRRIPEIFVAWTWASGIIANLFFFHRTGVAFFAGLFLGIFVIWHFIAVRFGRSD
jgi:uncharacterized membrane protein